VSPRASGEIETVPENSLVSTSLPDKKKVCAEKMSNSWMCSATSAPSSEFRKTTRCASCEPLTDQALQQLQPRFNKLYAKTGRPSIAAEKLLRALLLQALYSVRSERMLMEQLDYNLLFRWFLGLNMDDPIWDVTVFTNNRERLRDGDIAEAFFQAVLKQAREQNLLSDEHFTVDGTLLEAWASLKSFKRKDGKPMTPPDDLGNATVDFHGEKRSHSTHESKTDPDAKLARKGKGKEGQLSYHGNLLVENRNGLIVNTEVFQANGTAERDAALVMLEQIPGTKQVTVCGDKAYDTADFVAECRNLKGRAARRSKPGAARRKRD
jgi:transposase